MAFDERADGYGLGEGVGTIILKPLSAAIRDGDTIRAVIRSTGVNHDGRTAGMTYPSAKSQEALIRQTYMTSGLNPKDTTYVESHGTGTQAGDLVECTAITGAFETKQRKSPFYVGAVKPNVGHLEGGAGVTGIIKSVLLLESGIIPPNASLENVNSNIPPDWNLAFPTTCIPWPTSGIRRSSISSFGMSGTNAHCILDDAFHYLSQHGLSARHRTIEKPPSKKEIEVHIAQVSTIYHSQSNGIKTTEPLGNGHLPTTNAVNVANGTNGIIGIYPTNGSRHKDDTNGVNVVNLANGVNGINGTKSIISLNGSSYTNGADNLHLDLKATAPEIPDSPALLLFSAFDEKTLEKLVSQIKRHVSSLPLSSKFSSRQALNDLAFTLSERRSRLPWKTFAVCNSVDEAQSKLSKFPLKAVKSRSSLRLGFVFTGQGAQYAQMGQQLLVYPVFKESLKAAETYFRSLGSNWFLLEELSRNAKDSKISKSSFAHPLSCAVQIALLDLLLSWDIIPHRVTGHSSGEIAAAYCVSKISREAAWRVAYFRGHVLKFPKAPCAGGMIAVGLEEKPLNDLIKTVHKRFPGGSLAIACYNSPRNHTVSGDDEMVDTLKAILEEHGVFIRKLKVEHAAHSSHMEYFSKDYDELLGELPGKRKLHFDHNVQMFSTLTGRLLDDLCTPEKASHWRDSMVHPVKFVTALSSMCFDASPSNTSAAQDTWVDAILEVGPHPAMQSAFKEIVGTRADIPYFSTLTRKDNGLTNLLETVGNLAIHGASVDLDKVNRATKPLALPNMLVNLPPYPFNHEEQGLYESRLIKNTRLRQFPRHDLFGAPVPDWNPNSPRWRHFLRVAENPWLKEHVVSILSLRSLMEDLTYYQIGDNYVFPGSGYIVMAVEAMKQITDSTGLIGVNLRDIQFKSMLIVPDDTQGLEVCLSFYPVAESKTSLSAKWKRFEVSSYNTETEEWVEHCAGEISPDIKSSPNPINGAFHEVNKAADWSVFAKDRESKCQSSVDFEPVYKHLRDIGVNHGSIFRALSNVNISDRKEGLMTGDIIVPDFIGLMPMQFAHEHSIHPTTLDNAFHAAFAANYDLNGKQMMRRGCVPSFVREMWLSTRDLSSKPGTVLRCTSHALRGPHDSFVSSVDGWNPVDPSTKLFSLAGAKLMPFKPEGSDTTATDRRSYYNVKWQPDLDFLNTKEMTTLLPQPPIPPPSYATQLERFSKLQLASTLLVTDALVANRKVKESTLEDQHKHYLRILQRIASRIAIDDIPHVSLEMWLKYSRNPALKKRLFNQVHAQDLDGALLMKMGSNISAFLRNEIAAEHILYDLVDLFWIWDTENVYQGNILPTLQKFLALLRETRHSLRILDVRPISGALSEAVLKALEVLGAHGTTEYVVGASSDFEVPMKRLAAWGKYVKYQDLDLTINPIQQGFEPESFDLIISDDYIQGMLDERALSRLHSLTTPGGRILLLEQAQPQSLHTNVSFGPLSTSESKLRILGTEPSSLHNELQSSLREAGFSGIDFEALSSEYSELAGMSLIVSTASKMSQDLPPSSLQAVVVINSHSELSHLVTSKLAEAGIDYSICLLHELSAEALTGKVCISLLEAEEPILHNINGCTYQKLRELITACNLLLWVTGDPLEQPKFQMSTGLLRTIRWERDSNELNLTTLSLDGSSPAKKDLNANAVLRVLQRQFLSQGLAGPSTANAEYRVRNQVIESNRIVKDTIASAAIESQFSGQQVNSSRWDEIEHPVRLVTLSPGLDSLTWVTDKEHVDNPLKDNEVEVEVNAVGLNFKDLLVALGEISQPGFGHESAGTIVEVGKSVKNLRYGDWVMCLGDPSPGRMGTLRTRCRVHSDLAIKIPDSLDFDIAAGLPIIYGTVIYSLGHIARIRSGEKVLIHAAAGGIGQAAIQYAQFKGAEIFVTLSSIEKKHFVMETFGIPDDHIFSSRDLTFSAGIKRSSPAGVDVVLNSLSGETLRETWACIAPFGRFVEIGKLDFQAGSKLDMTPFQNNVTFSGVDLNALAEFRPEICQELLQEIIHLWSSSNIREARPTQVLNYGQVKEGMRMLQTGKSMGKITLTPGASPISFLPPPPAPLELDPKASFVLAGGLGGIGRSIALRLASRGAKNLIFLSRSVNVHAEGKKTIAKLRSLGCASHVFQCDISDESRLHEVFETIRGTLPPVRGCIQCSFVLKDGAFESMSHQDWQAALAPKVSGSWNLHELLPHVDFFLMLSSITGIVGNRSQANYNAGNNFQDALARYRVANGMRGSSVNLGAVIGIGFIAENSEYAGKHTFKAANPQTEEEVLATVEHLIDLRHQSAAAPDNAQLVCGLRTPTSYSLSNEDQPAHLGYPMFSKIPPSSGNPNAPGAEVGASEIRTRDLLQASTDQNDATKLVHKAIRNKMADLLNVSEDSFDDSLNVRANGVDSLIEMEFRTWITKELGATVPLKDLAKDLTQLSARIIVLSSMTNFH